MPLPAPVTSATLPSRSFANRLTSLLNSIQRYGSRAMVRMTKLIALLSTSSQEVAMGELNEKKRGKALGLDVDGAAGTSRQRFKRLDDDARALVAPGACDLPIQQERRPRVWRLRVEDKRPKAFRKNLRPAGMNQQGRVPGGEKA